MAGQTSNMIDGSDLLNEAVQAASQGNLARARAVAEGAIQEGLGDPAAFHGFLGMICARSNDLPKATQHLEHAHSLRPQDITIACNLISILMDQGRDADALAVASANLMRRDESLRVARFRGFLAQKLEDFAAAVEAYEFVIAKQPEDFECWNNLGNAHAGSIWLLRWRLSIGPKKPKRNWSGRLTNSRMILACPIDFTYSTKRSSSRKRLWRPCYWRQTAIPLLPTSG